MTTEDRKVQLGVSVDVTEAEQGFAKIISGGRNMGDELEKAGKKANKGINDIIDPTPEGPAGKVDRATRSIVASIQRATAAAESAGKSGSAFYESLANQRGANLEVLKPYLAQLDAVTQKQIDAKIAIAQGTVGLNEMGISAKATAAAMRGVPAQFTDIITSLQGGQAPMTVLLQQGGQLKDMFGGIGNASRALGGYIVGLINPMTLLAAAAGALGYAYYKGSQEADAYNKALILSGNVAGTTSGQLGTMAASIAKVTGTQMAAAAALAEMAQASGVGRDNLEAFTRAAIRFESTTGTAVSETVKQFKELAKSPLEASLKLNDTYNYLTASVYRQIKALDEQGKTTEAANLAQKAFADTLDTRSAQMIGNLGYIERGWKAIKEAVLGAGSAIAGIGRDASPADQAASLRKQLETRQQNGPTNELARASWEKGNEALKTQLGYLQEQERQLRKGADIRAQEAAQVKALADFDKEGIKYLSEKAKMERDIAAARNLGLAAGESEVSIQKRIRDIKESYNKKSPGKEANSFAADQEFAKEYAKAWEDFVKIGDAAAGKTDELSKAQERLVEYLKSPAYANHSAAMREIVLQSAYAAIKSETLAAEKKKEAAAIKEATEAAYANSDAIYKTLTATEDKLKAQVQEAETIGKTAVQIAQLARARDLEAAAALDAKAALYEQAGARIEDIDNIKATADALRKLADARLDSAVKKQELSDWQTFFTGIDSAARQVWTNVLQGGQDIWSKLRNTAKTIFFDWLYQMTVKKWIFSIGASVTGSGAMAQTASGGAPGIGDLGSVFKAAGSSWFTDFGGSLGNSINNIGGKLFDKGFETAGSSLIDFGNSLSSYKDVINGAGDALGYFNSALLASQGKWGASIGSAIGTYFGGPIGSVIGQAVGSWVDKLTGNTGTKPSIEGGYSTSGNPGTNGRAYSTGADGMYYGGALDATAKGFVTGTASDYATIVKGAGRQAGNLTAQAFVGLDGNNGSKGSQNKLDYAAYLDGKQIYNRAADLGTNNAGNGDAAMTDAAKESVSKAVLSALAETDLGPQLNKYLDTVKINGASLAEVTASLGDVTNFINFTDAVKNLPFDYLTNVSVEATKALITAAGGLDKLGQDISTYFELFGTEAEKKAATVGNLSTAFDKLGITMPQTTDNLREWYKGEVKRLGAMDLSIEANAKAYDSVLKLANGVDQLSKAEEQATATRQSWQDQLDVLTGKTTDTELQLKRDLASTTDESTKAIIRQVYAEKERKKATDDATAAEKTATDLRKSWQDRFDVLSGATTSRKLALEKDLASTTDESTRSLIKRIYALEDEKTASDAARSAAIDALEAQKTLAESFVEIGRSIKDYLTSLQTTETLGTTPQSRLEATRSQYVADLSAARGGDAEAYKRIVADSQAYIKAATDVYASGDGSQAVLEQVKSELKNLPAVTQYDQNLSVLKAIQASTEKTAANTYGLDQLARIRDVINAMPWGNPADDARSSRTLVNIAKANGWTAADIASAMGFTKDQVLAGLKAQGITDLPLGTWAANAVTGTSTAKPASTTSTSTGSGASFGGGSTAAVSPTSDYSYTTGLGLGGSITTPVADVGAFITSLDWGTPDAVARAVATSADFAKQNGLTQSDVAASLGLDLETVRSNMLAYGIPAFAVGTNYVPKDMLAQIHEGEAIVPKRFNPWADGQSGYQNSGELIAAVRNLDKRLAGIESNTAGNSINLTVVTPDGKKTMEQTLDQIKERSRRGELVVYTDGVK